MEYALFCLFFLRGEKLRWEMVGLFFSFSDLFVEFEALEMSVSVS